MLKEYKTMIILTLCCLTMVSIGFSSWVVTNPNTTEDVNGSLEADSIIDNRKYIVANEQVAFKYSQLGFIKNNIFSKEGEVTSSYTINTKACADYFTSLGEECNSLNLELTMKYAEGFSATYDIFNEGDVEVSYDIGSGYITENINSVVSDYQVCSTINITNITSTNLNVSFKFTFTIPYGASFKNGVYKELLSKEGFSFDFSAKLINGVGE